jgi:hypothetical protein
MNPQDQEIEKMAKSIASEMKLIFQANMKIFDWDIPENDEKRSAELILETMQNALDRLKEEAQKSV